MKARDSKGRFAANGGGFIFTFPSLSSILYYIILIFIFMPWLIILSKLNLLEKLATLFDSIFKEPEASEANKKNGLFY